jgi:hypothetical protein
MGNKVRARMQLRNSENRIFLGGDSGHQPTASDYREGTPMRRGELLEIAAEIQGEVAKHYDGQADQKQMQLEETAGIPTGIAPDIHRQVELRKAKRAATPDNLATEASEVRALGRM